MPGWLIKHQIFILLYKRTSWVRSLVKIKLFASRIDLHLDPVHILFLPFKCEFFRAGFTILLCIRTCTKSGTIVIQSRCSVLTKMLRYPLFLIGWHHWIRFQGINIYPESVSSKDRKFKGRALPIWKISFRFFQPPEKLRWAICSIVLVDFQPISFFSFIKVKKLDRHLRASRPRYSRTCLLLFEKLVELILDFLLDIERRGTPPSLARKLLENNSSNF